MGCRVDRFHAGRCACIPQDVWSEADVTKTQRTLSVWFKTVRRSSFYLKLVNVCRKIKIIAKLRIKTYIKNETNSGKIRKIPSAMQTITQSVVESHTKLVYKYIKQDVEAENNHTAKGRVEQMGTPTEIYKNPKTPFVAQFIGESAIITDYDRLKGFHLYPGCSRAIIRPEFVKAVRYGTEKRYQSLYAEGIVEQKSRGHCIPSVCGG